MTGVTRHWGGYSTAQQLRESNKAAQTHHSCNSSNRVWWGYACTSTQGFTRSCTLSQTNAQHRFLTYRCSFRKRYRYICRYTHPCTHLHPRTALMNTPIAERTVRWLAQRKHYTSTFRHMACGPTDGHTHMVLVASAASHGRKALRSPLIRLQITEHSTESTA